MTLVIMAAGMGSRYGGLKQIDPVGPNNEFIIDYSVYDAIKAGFTKVVFIIKEENFEIFKETIGKRVEKQIEVEYVFQDLDVLPKGFTKPEGRIKPWGTTHAILACKNVVKENFAIINADDFYGEDAYKVIGEFLKKVDETSYKACLVGYQVQNTLTENGAVKRGICESKNGYLTKLIESNVIEENGIITASPLDGSESFIVKNTSTVSMNMLGFTPKIFDLLEKDFALFLEKNKDNMEKCECVIPDSVFNLIKENKLNVELLSTIAKWYGVTYKEDKKLIVNEINRMIENKEYPINLW